MQSTVEKSRLNPEILKALILNDSTTVIEETINKLESVIKDLKNAKDLENEYHTETLDLSKSLEVCQARGHDDDARIKKLETENKRLLFELLEANSIIKEDLRVKNITYVHTKTKRTETLERNAHLWELVSRIYHEAITHWDSTHHFDLACEDVKNEWLKTESMSEEECLDIWDEAKEIYHDQTEGI